MQNNWLDSFRHEAGDLLGEIEESALALGGEPDAETVNCVFRAFHTIKGSSAMCGLQQVSEFIHHVENLLDDVRGGRVAVSPRLADLVLAAADQVKVLIAAEQDGIAVPPGSSERIIAMVEELSGTAEARKHSPGAGTAKQARFAPRSTEQTWKIRFRPDAGLLACGGNPMLLFADLRKLGPCEIVAHTDAVPPLAEFRPDLCYFWWTITLRTAAGENAIRDVFLFVEDGAELQMEAIASAAEVCTPEGDAVGASLPPRDAPQAPNPKDEPQREMEKTAAGNGRKGVGKESVVRVPSARLDRLVNLVGELVMNQARLSQAAAGAGAPELATPVQEMERLIAELRDDVLGIRMLPIGTIFGRFRRLVHDLSAELGKAVDLVTEGAETELDKSILDQLGDPLVHLLRNSIDHGIEPEPERAAKGKLCRGTIRLSAVHNGSHVVVSIEDDGRGIDRAAVRAKAVAQQLLAPDATLADRELLNLILLPGFSTAQQVTSVSGRGVGMDVVRKQIEALRGSLSMASEPGKGTRMSLALPLTLAIIEGLMVQVGGDQFIVPMAAVTENIDLARGQRRLNNGRNVTAVRGELVPYIDLRETFRIAGEAPAIEKIVIVHHEDQRVGLVVDRVLGTHPTVLQPLGKFFRNVHVVSGATIMGDGRVALILDIAAVVRLADRHSRIYGYS